jgi:hypothetical protein
MKAAALRRDGTRSLFAERRRREMLRSPGAFAYPGMEVIGMRGALAGVRRIGLWAVLGLAVGASAYAIGVAAASGRCGDGVCEGPETAVLCPQDCGAAAAPAGTLTSGTLPSGLVPNPVRAVVSENLLEWRDWLDDGGFEAGTACLTLLDPAGALTRASVVRSQEAARSGTWGLEVAATAGQGIVLGLRTTIEKGEDTRFSLWARSPVGAVSVPVRVLGVERIGAAPTVLYTLPDRFAVGVEWTRLELTIDNRRGLEYAILALDVGANTTLLIDDAMAEGTQWRMADPVDGGRVVGGVNVPAEPVAPVHFAILIHIEDPSLLQQQEAYFRVYTAIFTEMARTLHEHGGFLTIQPEEDWAMGAQRFAPTALADLAREFGVVYSTHTHGPNCIDADGRPRSVEDCNRSDRLAGWVPSVEDCCDPIVPVYVDNLQELLSTVSGTEVSDHNGNWEYTNPNALGAVGVETWSAFKSNQTQRTFDLLMNNPWRPSAVSARDNPSGFLVHDSATQVVYIPGWGQSLTQNLERVSARLAPMASQFIRFADPERVNTFYVVTHVGHFGSDDGTDYISVDPSTGRLTYSGAFLQDLATWDEALTEVIAPLVVEGYLEWTSLPQMGRLFVEWERQHGA